MCAPLNIHLFSRSNAVSLFVCLLTRTSLAAQTGDDAKNINNTKVCYEGRMTGEGKNSPAKKDTPLCCFSQMSTNSDQEPAQRNYFDVMSQFPQLCTAPDTAISYSCFHLLNIASQDNTQKRRIVNWYSYLNGQTNLRL